MSNSESGTCEKTIAFEPSEWRGCYDNSWRGVIVDEAFAHPAKFSYGLIRRIYQHCLNRGWLKPGDTVGDPFGGVGLGGLVAANAGLRWIGVELETLFTRIADGYDFPGMSKQEWVRWFSRERQCPYLAPDMQFNGTFLAAYRRDKATLWGRPGRIPELESYRYRGNFDSHRDRWEADGLPIPKIIRGDSREFASLVQECGAIVTSPPYAETMTGGQPGTGEKAAQQRYARLKAAGYNANAMMTPGRRKHNLGTMEHYGSTPGQIGALKAKKLDGIVTSPPYASSDNRGGTKMENGYFAQVGGIGTHDDVVPNSPSQIGNTKAETYWEAVRTVYQQCRLALKPGGMMAVVIKDYVSKGKRIPLCDQTVEVLMMCGFFPRERARATLVAEDRHPGLFGCDVVKTKERKSFFRRLAEQRGSPRIDYEEVLFVCR